MMRTKSAWRKSGDITTNELLAKQKTLSNKYLRQRYTTFRTLGLVSLKPISSESNKEWKTNQAIAHKHSQEGYL
jgi:hypothetical protein